MKKLEFYNGKTYMFPTGKIANKETVLANYPAAAVFKFVVTTDENGEVMWGMDNFSALRTHYNIDSSLSDDEAITEIEEIINNPIVPEVEPSAEERIAAALEFQTMMMLPDEEDI